MSFDNIQGKLSRKEMRKILGGATSCSNSCTSITDCLGTCSCNETTCTCQGATKSLVKSCLPIN